MRRGWQLITVIIVIVFAIAVIHFVPWEIDWEGIKAYLNRPLTEVTFFEMLFGTGISVMIWSPSSSRK